MQTEVILVDKLGKMCNLEAVKKQPSVHGVTYPNGLSSEQLLELGYHYLEIKEKPEDFSDETYYRTEQTDAPYIIYTKKSQEQLNAVRWEKIKSIRDNLLQNGGCLVSGKWFHSDLYSKVQQLALVMAGQNLPSGLQWKTMDGSFITMTPELALAIYSAQVSKEQLIFGIAEAKKLDSSNINEGWPETYQGV